MRPPGHTQILDASRNALIRLDVMLSMGTFSLSFGTAGAAFMGMNLPTGWESNPNAFAAVVAGCSFLSAGVFTGLYRSFRLHFDSDHSFHWEDYLGARDGSGKAGAKEGGGGGAGPAAGAAGSMPAVPAGGTVLGRSGAGGMGAAASVLVMPPPGMGGQAAAMGGLSPSQQHQAAAGAQEHHLGLVDGRWSNSGGSHGVAASRSRPFKETLQL